MKYLLLGILFAACRPGNPRADLHIINLSLPRTATTSFAGIFENHGATHEYMLSRTILTLMDYREKKISAADLTIFLRERETQAGHRVDSASFYFLAPDAIISNFPESKYFLSVRHCEPWVLSMVDNSVFVHQMIREGKVQMDISFLDRYSEVFIKDYPHNRFNDVRTVAADARKIVRDLARFWGENNILLLNAILAVPRANRLVIRTENFSAAVPQFAALAGINPLTLNTANLHLNKDRDLKYYRRLLGEKTLREFCSPEESILRDWLAAHKNELELAD